MKVIDDRRIIYCHCFLSGNIPLFLRPGGGGGTQAERRTATFWSENKGPNRSNWRDWGEDKNTATPVFQVKKL